MSRTYARSPLGHRGQSFLGLKNQTRNSRFAVAQSTIWHSLALCVVLIWLIRRCKKYLFMVWGPGNLSPTAYKIGSC